MAEEPGGAGARGREPGDPGVPYDPDAPERLMPRSASMPSSPPPAEPGLPPLPPAPYGGGGPDRHWNHPGRRRGWGGGAVAVLGIIALVSWSHAGHRDRGDDGTAQIVAVGSGVSTIRIDGDSDDVMLTRAPDATRQVTISGGSASSSQDGGVLTLRPDDDATFRVPEGVRVEVTTHSGDISADDLATREVTVRSDSGDIDLGFSSPPVDVDAETDSADIDISLPSANYAVDAHSDSGDEDPGRTDPTATNRIRARSDSGDITVDD